MRTQVIALVLCAASTAGAQVAAGDVALRTRAEQQLMNSIIVGDSLEAAMAQRVAARTQNAAVKELATMLATDHTAHAQSLAELSKSEKVGRLADPSDTTAIRQARVIVQLDSMAVGKFLDQAFVREQITHHANAIATLKAKRPLAHDDDFEKAIDQTIPLLQKHLEKAKTVGTQLGVTVP